MFVSHEMILDAGFEAVGARLAALVADGDLYEVSDAAYRGGSRALMRVGPFGAAPGLSKLVRVRVVEGVRRGACVTASLRWEATGRAGELFPVLDADLMLVREGEHRCRLGLVGSYRPPLGSAGAVLDRAVMGRVATATVRTLLRRLGRALTAEVPRATIGSR